MVIRLTAGLYPIVPLTPTQVGFVSFMIQVVACIAIFCKKKAPPKRVRLFYLAPGSDLLSHGNSRTTIGDASFHC